VAITVAYNVLVTSLICGRVFFTYLSIKRLGITSDAERWGIIAILIESALPFSIFGVIFAVFYATSNPLADAFADIWGNLLVKILFRLFHTLGRQLIASILLLQGLSPQLIVLRVAMGHTWTKNSVGTSG
jgi:hypothetical protein